jgi:hypothetical protein
MVRKATGGPPHLPRGNGCARELSSWPAKTGYRAGGSRVKFRVSSNVTRMA